jgi:hypothetical protein
MNCILHHNCNLKYIKCTLPIDKICAWDDYDYSDPRTKLIKYLKSDTKATIIRRKFPGILVEIDDGSQYWICEWDVYQE